MAWGVLKGAVGRKPVQQGELGGVDVKATVQFYVWCCWWMCKASRTLLLQYIASFFFSNRGIFPVDLLLIGPGVQYNFILGVILLHCCLNCAH